jgi:hypothetical protein
VRPQDAVDRARTELDRMRAQGAYPESEAGPHVTPLERPSTEDMLEWALLEPDMELVTSTRRLVAPVRWL